jgi:hypothetical protein
MTNRFAKGRAIGLLLVVVAAACGSDSTSEVEAAAGEAANLESVGSISADSESAINAAFDAVGSQAEGAAFATMRPALSDALHTVVSTQREAIARYKELVPPDVYAKDHEERSGSSTTSSRCGSTSGRLLTPATLS